MDHFSFGHFASTVDIILHTVEIMLRLRVQHEINLYHGSYFIIDYLGM